MVDMPPLQRYLEKLGFDENPFQYTNADDEERLSQYFVSPPYFASVLGDTNHPTSCMVFAPRGAGKSAQRRMVELSSSPDDVLCITYDDFRDRTGRIVVNSTLAIHQTNVVRLIIVGLLSAFNADPERATRLSADQKLALRRLAVGFLGNVSQPDLVKALRALRNLPETAKAIWNDNRWVLASVLSSLNLLAGGPGSGHLPRAEDDYDLNEPYDALVTLNEICADSGFRSVYVLVDRIDETIETQASTSASYSLIAPLMHDLHLLEFRPLAFKFFVPDYIYPLYENDGGRSDRIKTYHTDWRNTELIDMLNRRLSVFSHERIDDISKLVNSEDRDFVVFLSLCFAMGSPRDLIRIWARAQDEQLRLDSDSTLMTLDAMEVALDAFAGEKALELATGAVMRDLVRVGRVDFTVSELANDVLHIDTNTARRRVQLWEQRSVVKQVGELPVGRGRPHHHFSVVDLRVARSMFPDMALPEFMEYKTRYCRKCDSWTTGDWDDDSSQRSELCVSCGGPVEAVF